MPVASQGRPRLADCCRILESAAVYGHSTTDLEQRAAAVIAAIEYVAWRLNLDWDVINTISAAETLRLQELDRT